MTYNSVVISSGHGKYIRGASCPPPGLDEVDEARKVVNELGSMLVERGVVVKTYHDDVSKTQNENLNRIVDYHNSQKRDLDISVHFNAYQRTTKPIGTECLYVTQDKLAKEVSAAIASCGFINRGPKKRTDLFFLNKTAMPSILIEVCFVDSEADADIYRKNFFAICDVIAGVISGKDINVDPPDVAGAFSTTGKCSYFGGPDDMGVSPSEGLAFISKVEQAPQLFLDYQPQGTTGLARRLDPEVHYVACRWDYSKTPKSMLLEEIALVSAPKTGRKIAAYPADWGPHESTGRVADLSPGLMSDLGIATDDIVEVVFPYAGNIDEPAPEPDMSEVLIEIRTPPNVRVTVRINEED